METRVQNTTLLTLRLLLRLILEHASPLTDRDVLIVHLIINWILRAHVVGLAHSRRDVLWRRSRRGKGGRGSLLRLVERIRLILRRPRRLLLRWCLILLSRRWLVLLILLLRRWLVLLLLLCRLLILLVLLLRWWLILILKKTYCNQNVNHSNCCYSKYISYCIRSKYLPVETRISIVSSSCFDIGCSLNPCINPQLNFTKAIHLIFKSVRYMHLTCSAHYTVLRKRTYNTANLPVIYHAVFLK